MMHGTSLPLLKITTETVTWD